MLRITTRAAQIASIRPSARAGLSGARLARRLRPLSRPNAGLDPAGQRQVQRELDWRSPHRHETRALLALSFNHLSGTVRAFAADAATTPSADFRGAVRRLATPSAHCVSTQRISRGKPGVFSRTPIGFTPPALDGYGLCDSLPARPTDTASYPLPVRQAASSRRASSSRSLAVPPSRFCSYFTSIRSHTGLSPRRRRMPGTQGQAQLPLFRTEDRSETARETGF